MGNVEAEEESSVEQADTISTVLIHKPGRKIIPEKLRTVLGAFVRL